MRVCLPIALLALMLLTSCQSGGSDPAPDSPVTFEPNWTSLQEYQCPEWFRDAKFGIFIHWGPYAVPGFGNEWYPCNMYREGYEKKYHELRWNYFEHHLENYGSQKDFGYKDFIPMFKAEQFDAREWLDIFKSAGAKYVVPVGEHHDGFAMYASTLTRWNAVNMGPKRDIVGELASEIRLRDLKLGISSHFAENWYYFTHSEEFDTGDPDYHDLYGRPHEAGAPADKEFQELFHDRTREIIDLYQPDLIWFDAAINAPELMEVKLNLLSYYYNRGLEWNKGVVFNYKNDIRHHWREGCAVLDIERGKRKDKHPLPWQTDTSVGRQTWGYTTDMIVKPAGEIIDALIDIVSKNGNLLLNIGPRADGIIPENQKQCLLDIGKWLDVNGEAIFGTRPWKIFGEGPTVEDLHSTHMNERANEDLEYTASDLRFTTKGEDLYVICLGVPESEILVKSLGYRSPYYDANIKKIQMLGSEKILEFEVQEEGLLIHLPKKHPDLSEACSFKIVFEESLYWDKSIQELI